MPPHTLIFGGHGQTALHITKLLLSSGHTITSIIRNASQIPELEALGAHPIVQDITQASASTMASTITTAGSQTPVTAILWCATAAYGSSASQVHAVDGTGCIKTQDAAAQAGVKRYVSVSALDVRDRAKVPFPPWYAEEDRKISERVSGAIGLWLEAKLESDRSLVTGNEERGLEYTIVRPNGLTGEEGKGKVEAGRVHLGKMVAREDVAAVVVECLKNGETKGLVFDVVGGETAVTDAVGRVAKEREDSFEGTY